MEGGIPALSVLRKANIKKGHKKGHVVITIAHND